MEMIHRTIDKSRDELISIAKILLQTPSAAPEAPTAQIAEVIRALLQDVDGAEVTLLSQGEVTNVLAILNGGGPGRRLVINGHLDTYPVVNEADWSHGPFKGELEDGRIYGRGACDMKCGIACALLVFRRMAQWRRHWRGQLVLTLVGDEQRMGPQGTKYLLDTQPLACGDGMLSADVGGPGQLCFGEKGYLWLDVTAEGVMTHGAQVNKGVNAINRLMAAVTQLNEELPCIPFTLPDAVERALQDATKTTDPKEIELMRSLTVNLGYIEGGVSANLIPDKALAKLDIRLPAGVTCVQIEREITRIISWHEGVHVQIRRSYDPNWSCPSQEIFTVLRAAANAVLAQPACLTYRIGASDARYYRKEKGVPTVTCGLTAHNHGAADEYAEISEMEQLSQIYLAAALAFLKPAGAQDKDAIRGD